LCDKLQGLVLEGGAEQRGSGTENRRFQRLIRVLRRVLGSGWRVVSLSILVFELQGRKWGTRGRQVLELVSTENRVAVPVLELVLTGTWTAGNWGTASHWSIVKQETRRFVIVLLDSRGPWGLHGDNFWIGFFTGSWTAGIAGWDRFLLARASGSWRLAGVFFLTVLPLSSILMSHWVSSGTCTVTRRLRPGTRGFLEGHIV
jgi:hypothetical protein